MKKQIATTIFAISALTLATGCENDGDNPFDEEDPGDEIATLSLSGSLVDFSTGEAIAGGATVSTDGLSPPPSITVTGSNFEIDGVPPYSNFHLLVGSPPNYRSTYSIIIETADSDQSGLEFEALSEDFIDSLYAGFAVTPTDGTSLIVAKLIDEEGAVAVGVPGSAFDLEPSMAGPYFLDADRLPQADLSASTSSGYVVVFNVEPGLVSFVADTAAELSLTMADSPVANRAATLAEIVVSEGAIVVPTGVSFSADVTPIFENRGCTICHSGGGIGKDLGGLHLNGESQKMYRELAEEISANHATTRVNLLLPEQSLMLTMPSKEDPPDVHPNSTFLSKTDPDYLTILGWVQEGALNN